MIIYIFTLIIIGLMVFALAKEMLSPGLLLFTVLVIFTAAGIITTNEALAGFSNKGMITVAILFVISSAVEQTGLLSRFASANLPKKKGCYPKMALRVLAPVSFLSAFLNNTPVVIMFMPVIKKWTEKIGIAPSKFLIPLSYAAIFGGICTLIGTSTNLVVHGLMLDAGFDGLGMFELAKVGIPVAAVGYLYLVFIGHRLLPDNKNAIHRISENEKEYLTEFVITSEYRFSGRSIREAGLRSLEGVFLTAIVRDELTIETVNDDEQIFAGDHLLFTGNTDRIDDLRAIKGLVSIAEDEFRADFGKIKQHLVEVVVSPSFPGLGKTVLEYNFRSTYRAVIVAVHRNGERINSKIGDITLKPGDALVLLTTKNFVNRWKNNQDFFLVSDIRELEQKKSKPGSWVTIGLVVLMVIGATAGRFLPVTKVKLDMFFFAAVVFVVLAWMKRIDAAGYTSKVSWDILITIACAFGISRALVNSGTADFLAGHLISAFSCFGPAGVLAGVYLITTVFTEIITNNAAAALMFPISLAAAQRMGLNPEPFFIAICIAASASFSTPIGYQTNLIVKGAGGYRFKDYLRVGLPLNVLAMITSVLVIPLFWEF